MSPVGSQSVEGATAHRLAALPWPALGRCLPLVVAAVERVLQREPGERVLDRALRAVADDREARAVMAEAVFGVGLWRRRLAYHAGSEAALPLLFCFLRDLAGLDESTAAELVGLPQPLPPRRPPPADLATRFSLPDWLAAELLERFDTQEAEAFATSINLPGPMALRANRLRISVDALRARLEREGLPTRPGHHARGCLVVEAARANLLALPAYREGLFEVQDEGSQLLSLLLEPRPGESVLDLCAGAGGKTLALAAAMEDRGALHVFDVDETRLVRLRGRARRAGVTCLVWHPGGVAADLRVDRVLVDAPCSELGALRRGPDLRFRLDPGSFAALERTQRDLLQQAARRVKPGGRLVYATCTIRAAENQEQIRAFLAVWPKFRSVHPPWLPATFRRGAFFEALPQRHDTDGFFAAVLERGEGSARG